MRKIREILRLSLEKGLSQRAIERSCHVSYSTVNEFLKLAKKEGLNWPLPERMTEEDLYQKLYPERQ